MTTCCALKRLTSYDLLFLRDAEMLLLGNSSVLTCSKRQSERSHSLWLDAFSFIPKQAFVAKFTTLVFLLMPGVAKSQTLNWASLTDSAIVDSGGGVLNETFIFQLGAFDPAFKPIESNLLEWAVNWRVFDTADYANDLSSQTGYFTGTQALQDVPDYRTMFQGLTVYLWIRNAANTDYFLASADAKPGVAGTPLPGLSVLVVDQDGNQLHRDGGEDEAQGLLAIMRPWPAMLRNLYRDPDRYVETYWSKFGPDTYFVGDAARHDEDGYISIIGRVDDVINVSGHRLSTAEVESAIVSHPKVAEAAVIGQADEDTGQAIAAFVTLEGELEGTDAMVAELREHVAQRIGKLARPKRIIFSDDLPKTRSGKIMRRLLRDVAEGRALGDVTTLRDPDVMARLEAQIKAGAED